MLSIALRATALGFALVSLTAMATPGLSDDKDKDEKKVELKVGDKAPGFEAGSARTLHNLGNPGNLALAAI